LAAVGSLIGWILARREKRAAADHAKEALDAARDAVAAQQNIGLEIKRNTDIRQAQETRLSVEREAAEQDPWTLEPISGDEDCYIVNLTVRPSSEHSYSVSRPIN
jgi:hypothetical protein